MLGCSLVHGLLHLLLMLFHLDAAISFKVLASQVGYFRVYIQFRMGGFVMSVVWVILRLSRCLFLPEILLFLLVFDVILGQCEPILIETGDEATLCFCQLSTYISE